MTPDASGEPKALTELDIPWGSNADVPRPERMPARLLALLTREELLNFAFGLQDDDESLRITLHESTRLLAAVTAKLDTANREIWRLRDELRRLHEASRK